MENASARTLVSGFVYWIAFALLIAMSIWKIRSSWNHGNYLLNIIDAPAVWVPLISTLFAPAPLLLATVAHFLRSGATIWIIGVMAVQFLPNIPMTGEDLIQSEDIGFAAGRIAAMLVAFSAVLTPYVFLIRSGELRKP